MHEYLNKIFKYYDRKGVAALHKNPNRVSGNKRSQKKRRQRAKWSNKK